MKMRPGRATGHADRTDRLTLTHHVAYLHVDSRKMQKRAVQAHAVVDHQEITLKRERRGGGKDDDTIGRRGDGRSGGPCDINTRMRRAGFAAINAL